MLPCEACTSTDVKEARHHPSQRLLPTGGHFLCSAPLLSRSVARVSVTCHAPLVSPFRQSPPLDRDQ